MDDQPQVPPHGAIAVHPGANRPIVVQYHDGPNVSLIEFPSLGVFQQWNDEMYTIKEGSSLVII
jgi:hypothetical protein